MSPGHLTIRARRTVLALWIAGVLMVAGFLRFNGLGERPVHFDEATGAQILADRKESQSYTFDPSHFHGPMLSTLAEPWCRLNSQYGWEDLRIRTLRQVTATAGMLAIAGIFLFGFGAVKTALAISFVATSPLLVYYSRMYIHEPVFVLSAVPALAGLLFLKSGRYPRTAATLLGLGIGAMASTRETVAISILAWGAAFLLYAFRAHFRHSWRFTLREHRPRWQPFFYAALGALLVIFLAYSGGGRNPSGFLEFFSTYFHYETVQGHEKPFGYFLNLLLWPKLSAGVWWTEGGIFLLALCVYLGKRDRLSSASGRFILEAGLFHLLIHSLIAYKTPWLASLAWYHICLAAAFGAVALFERFRPAWRWVPTGLVAFLLIWQTAQAQRAAFRLGSDARNPYAYVPTSPDLERLPRFLEEVLASISGLPERPIAVVGDEYWPLPWYLRESGPTGFWPSWPEEARQYPVLLIMASSVDGALPRLESSHAFLPWGLRNETPLLIAIRDDYWNAYLER